MNKTKTDISSTKFSSCTHNRTIQGRKKSLLITDPLTQIYHELIDATEDYTSQESSVYFLQFLQVIAADALVATRHNYSPTNMRARSHRIVFHLPLVVRQIELISLLLKLLRARKTTARMLYVVKHTYSLLGLNKPHIQETKPVGLKYLKYIKL